MSAIKCPFCHKFIPEETHNRCYHCGKTKVERARILVNYIRPAEIFNKAFFSPSIPSMIKKKRRKSVKSSS